MDYIENLQVFGENFSITDKLKEFAINEEFKNQSTIWDIVSGSCEEIGAVIYEKLINFIKNTKDLDYCSLHSLYAIAKELDVGDSFTYDIEYPSELNKLMNIFSMNPSHFYKSDTMSSSWMEMFKLDFPLRVKEIEGENTFKCLTTNLYSNTWKVGQTLTPVPTAMDALGVGTDYIKYKADSISTSILSGYTFIANNAQTSLTKLSTHFILDANSAYERLYFTMRINEHADRAICIHGLIHWLKSDPNNASVELFEYKRVGNLLIEIEGETVKSLNCNIQFSTTYSNNILTVTPVISRASILFLDITADIKLVVTHITSKYNKLWELPNITSANINSSDYAKYSLTSNDIDSFMIDQETVSSGIYLIKVLDGDEVKFISDLYILRDINTPTYVNYALAHDLIGSFSDIDVDIRILTNSNTNSIDKILLKLSGTSSSNVTYQIMKLAATPFDPKLLLDNNICSYCQTYGLNPIVSSNDLSDLEFHTRKLLHYENGKFAKNKFTYNENMTDNQIYNAYTFGTYDIMVLNNDYNSKTYYNINVINKANSYNDFIHETTSNTSYEIPIDRIISTTKQTYDNENNRMCIVMDTYNTFFMSSIKTLKLIQSFPEDFNYSTLYGKWKYLPDSTNTLEVTAVMVDLNTNDIIEISNNTADYKSNVSKEEKNVYPEIFTDVSTDSFIKYKISDILRPGVFRVNCLNSTPPTLIGVDANPCVIRINSQLINLIEKSIGRLIDNKIFNNYNKYVLQKLSVDKKLSSLSVGDKLLADQVISDRNTYSAFLDSILQNIYIYTENGIMSVPTDDPEEIILSKKYTFSEVLTMFDKLTDIKSDRYIFLNQLLHTNLLKSRKILRTICTKAALMRDVFKYVAQKHSMIGTVNAIQKVMQEYILRSYTKRTDWRMDIEALRNVDPNNTEVFDVTELEKQFPYLSEWAYSRNRNINDTTINNVLNDDFAINIIEYRDTTEYFNISAQSAMKYVVDAVTPKQVGIEYKTIVNSESDVEIVASPIIANVTTYKTDGYVIPEEAQKNVRFWEVGEADLYSNSVLSKSDFIDFYKNLGFNYTKVGSTTITEVDDSTVYSTVNSLLKADGGIYDVHAPSGLDRLSILPQADFLSDELSFSDMSVMQNLYSENSDNEIMSALNHKNITYPTIAPQPWLYNFVEIILGQYPKMLSTLFPSTVKEKYNIENEQIDWSRGLTKDSWRCANQEFIGYQTFYEESNNYDSDNKPNEDIDRDGPMKLEALYDFLSAAPPYNSDSIKYHYRNFIPNSLSTVDKDIIWNTYYSPKLNYTFSYNWKEYDDAGTLISSEDVNSTYLEEIIKLKDKIISHYAFDQYNNHYMLYKDLDIDQATGIKTDPNGGPGELWVRLSNHPLPYKLSMFNKEHNLTTNTISDSTAYTIDTTLENLAIYHFDINENIMIVHCECFLPDDIPPKRLLICDINYRFSDISMTTNTNDFNIDLLKVRTIKIQDGELYLGHYVTQTDIVFFILDGANEIRIEYFDIDNYTKIKQSGTVTFQLSDKMKAKYTTEELVTQLTTLKSNTIDKIDNAGTYIRTPTNSTDPYYTINPTGRIRKHYPAIWTSSYDKFYVACETMPEFDSNKNIIPDSNNIFVLEFSKLNPEICTIYEYDTFNLI